MNKLLLCLMMLLIDVVRPGGVPIVRARPPVLAADLRAALDRSGASEMLDVIVTLRDQADLSQLDRSSVPAVLRRHALEVQRDLLAMLHAQPPEQVQAVSSLWIDNAVAVSASPHTIRALAQRPEVAHIYLDSEVLVSTTNSYTTQLPANLALIGVAAAWQRGITGQGVVVAVLDTGADLLNDDLRSKWRGGANSWFDPYGEHDTPIDLNGHGTQMLGVILGGDDELGAPTGIAPGARWIAARIFNDRGRATASAIHRALQWLLDPDGDPATDDAPQVVNNSWSFSNPGCQAEFAADLRALRAAGILPVFAAGIDRTVSPANLPEAFAVGGLTDATTLSTDSARGPSECADEGQMYPQLVAPGDGIHTTDRYGAYITAAGTSLAAAHVSGALALVLSIRPDLSAAEQAALLTATAVDLGERGPDNDYGYGRLDVAALIDRATAIPAWPWAVAGAGMAIMIIAVVLNRRGRRPTSSTIEVPARLGVDWRDLDR